MSTAVPDNNNPGDEDLVLNDDHSVTFFSADTYVNLISHEFIIVQRTQSLGCDQTRTRVARWPVSFVTTTSLPGTEEQQELNSNLFRIDQSI